MVSLGEEEIRGKGNRRKTEKNIVLEAGKIPTVRPLLKKEGYKKVGK